VKSGPRQVFNFGSHPAQALFPPRPDGRIVRSAADNLIINAPCVDAPPHRVIFVCSGCCGAPNCASSIARRFQSKQNGERKLLVPINYWLQVRLLERYARCKTKLKMLPLFFAGDFLRIAVFIMYNCTRAGERAQ
jgi:hypothetical protein